MRSVHAPFLASLAAVALAASSGGDIGVRDLTLGASGGPEGVRDLTLGATGTDRALHQATLGALAPAPDKVVRVTRSFGSVTVDHRAHLARKAHCADCHGPGPVTKIEFTPRLAHDRCIGCHREQKKGPMGCRECHVVTEPKPAPIQVAKADAKSEPLAAGAPGAAPLPQAPAGTAASVAAAIPAPGGATAPVSRSPLADVGPTGGAHGFVRVLSIGFAGLAAQGQSASSGPGVFFTARDEDLVLSLSIETPGRTLGLLGAGKVFPLRPRWNVVGSVVGGFDAAQRPSVAVMPALGARAGVEWMGASTTVGFCLTGVSDLVRKTDALGQQVGGVSVSGALTVGWVARDR
jgi:hypothetical protein